MLKKLLVGFGLMALAIGAEAKVGDTFGDLVKAYGAPVSTQGVLSFWINNGWVVFAAINANSLVQCQCYIKLGSAPITSREQKRLDAANITVYCPGWKTIPQQSTDKFASGVGYISTGDVFFEVFEGKYLNGF